MSNKCTIQIGPDLYESREEAARAYCVSPNTIRRYERDKRLDLLEETSLSNRKLITEAEHGKDVIRIGDREWDSIQSCAISLSQSPLKIAKYIIDNREEELLSHTHSKSHWDNVPVLWRSREFKNIYDLAAVLGYLPAYLINTHQKYDGFLSHINPKEDSEFYDPILQSDTTNYINMVLRL